MARKLEVQIVGDASSATRALSQVSHAGERFGASLASWAKGAVVFNLVNRGIDAVSSALKSGYDEWVQSTEVQAQTVAALKSTHEAANITAQGIDKLAQSVMSKTGVDDEAVKQSENLLLAFTNVRNEVGAGNDIFTQATWLIQDYAARTGKDATKATIAFGKALNDPVHGLGGLSKAGVQFTDSQKKAMAAMVKSGDMMGAQKIIIGALTERFGGAAKAAGETLPGKLRILHESLRNIEGDLMAHLAPALSAGVGFVDKFITKVGEAQGTKAKFEVALDLAENAGKKIEQKIGDAIASVDWNAVWAKAKGIGSGLEHRFESINWTSVGSTIGNGFSDAVDKALSGTKGLPSAFERAFRSIDWNKLGRAAGPGIAAAIVTAFVTISSPGFWIKNWDLALAVALAVFPVGKFLKIGILLERVFGPMILRLGVLLERLSPRLAEAFVSGMLKVPGLLGGLGSRLEGLVGGLFNRLGGLAKFTVKVLGIQAAIDAVISLGKKIWAELSKLASTVYAAGVQIGQQILHGIGAGITSLAGEIAGKAASVVHGVIGAMKSAAGIKSPSLVAAKEIGGPIMQGVAKGITDSASIAEQAAVGAVGKTLRAAHAEVNRLQGQMDADQRRRTDADNARAVSDAETALATARKKNKGVADAEKALADAQQAIRDTAAQRQLDRAQKHLDRVQAQYDRAQAKLQAAQEKAAAKLAAIRDKSLAAFDKVAAKIQSAFDAKSSAWTAPAQRAIDAIMGRRQVEDMQQAVDDASKAVADARKAADDANGLQQNDNESDAEYAARKAQAVMDANTQLLGAQRSFERAKEDITVAGLQSDASLQAKAHDEQVAAQQEQLDAWIATVRAKIDQGKGAWAGSMQDMLDTIAKFDGGFATVGKLLGDAFAKSLLDSVNAAAGTATTAISVTSAGGGVRPDDRAGPRGPGVSVASRGGDTYNVNLPNYLGDKTEVTQTIRSELTKISRSNVGLFG